MKTDANTTEADRAQTTWLTTKQMAQRVKLHEKTLLRLAREKVIPCLRAGRAYRFNPLVVEQALTQQAVA